MNPLNTPPSSPGKRTTRPSQNKALPFLFVNMAMTADGKIATANRDPASFSSRRDHEHLLELRATADAVMAGARTVDLNPVNLGPGPARFRELRLKNGLAEYNLRIIASGSGSVDPAARIFQKRFAPILILTTARMPPATGRRLRPLTNEVKVCGETAIDFRAAFHWLREQWGVKRLLCEGGGELNAALFRAGLVDELHLTLCPRILGGRAAPTIADGAFAPKLAQACALQLRSVQRIGDELFLVYGRGSSGRSISAFESP